MLLDRVAPDSVSYPGDEEVHLSAGDRGGPLAPGEDKQAMLNFGCTRCGKCCTLPQWQDIFAFIDELPRLGTRLLLRGVVELGPPIDKLAAGICRKHGLDPTVHAKELARALDEQYPVLTVPRPPYAMSVSVRMALISGIDRTCAALADKRCTLYDDRPYCCRSFPVPINLPAAIAETVTRAFLRDGLGCDTGETAPPFIDGATILDEGYRETRRRFEEGHALRKKASRLALEQTGLAANLPAMIDGLMRKQPVSHIDLLPLIATAIALDLMTPAEGRAVVEAQIALAKARIAAAKAAKAASEKMTTAMLEHFVSTYAAALRDGRV